MKDRDRNMVIRVDDDELARLHALAEAGDEPISAMVRRWLRERYVARFGDAGDARPEVEAPAHQGVGVTGAELTAHAAKIRAEVRALAVDADHEVEVTATCVCDGAGCEVCEGFDFVVYYRAPAPP